MANNGKLAGKFCFCLSVDPPPGYTSSVFVTLTKNNQPYIVGIFIAIIIIMAHLPTVPRGSELWSLAKEYTFAREILRHDFVLHHSTLFYKKPRGTDGKKINKL